MLSSGYLSTKGNQIVDANGNAVRIASVGWNQIYSNVIGDISQNVKAMKEAGFNTIRVSWVNATMANDLRTIDQVVAAAKTYGLKVILDNHTNEAGTAGDGWGAQQQNGLWYDVGGVSDGTNGAGVRGTVTDAKFLSDWVAVANHFKGNDTVIGFDIRNEPLAYGGMCTWGDGNINTDIRLMYQRVGNAIQAVDAGKLIICEGPQNYNSSFAGTGPAPWGDLSLAGSKPVTLNVANKVVYSVHDYPRYVMGGSHPESGDQKVAMMNKAWGYLVTQNIAPVWIGEMGANFDGSYANENIAGSKAWAQTLLDYMNGKLGHLGGPTFKAGEQGIGGDWWAWGYLNGQQLNGTLNANGSFRSVQQEYWSQMVMQSVPGGVITDPDPNPPIIDPVTAGTGPDKLVLKITGDAYANGDGTSDAAGHARFTVSVDGKQIGGTFTALAARGTTPQTFTLNGTFGTGTHNVVVNFVNDAWGGTSNTDRNLYVESITYRGVNTNQSAEMYGGGARSFTITGGTSPTDPQNPVNPPAVTVGTGPDRLVLRISGDAYANNDGTSDAAGHAQFTVSIDGKQLGGTFTALAEHGKTIQPFRFFGSFGTGNHNVVVRFLNDASGAGGNRNLYVELVNYRGVNTKQSASLLTNGSKTFAVSGGTPPAPEPPPPPPVPGAIGSGSDTIVVKMSQDPDGPAGAAGRDAQFTLNVDGKQIGGLQTVTASRAAGQTQTFTFQGNYAPGAHKVTITFANNSMTQGDKAAFNTGGDRNLYVEGLTYNGTVVSSSRTGIYESPLYPPEAWDGQLHPGNAVFTVNDTSAIPANAPSTPTTTPGPVTVGSGADKLVLMMAEDPYNGDAQFTVAVDGKQVGGTLTTSAVQWMGQAQQFNLLGNWGGGTHTVTVRFLNDAAKLDANGWGIDNADRNLYIVGLSYNGKTGTGAPWEIPTNSSHDFTVSGTSVSTALNTTTQMAFATTGDASASDPGTQTGLAPASAAMMTTNDLPGVPAATAAPQDPVSPGSGLGLIGSLDQTAAPALMDTRLAG
ncbi:MAG: carbohydrate-binding domain-containing protein [Acetobacteraceae bacterium]